jgi:hypothetical protein
MTCIKKNTESIMATSGLKSMPRQGVRFDSKLFTGGGGDEALLQALGKRRRYMRRGSKSASMLKMAAVTVQTQYDKNERVIFRIRQASSLSPRPTLQAALPLNFCSTQSLIDEATFLEKLLATHAAKTCKSVIV